MTPGNDEIGRLRSRLERERRARRQAEIIAERGMRELWAANNELQRRVTTRTGELMTAIGALERQQLARSIVIERAVVTLADQLDPVADQPGGASSIGSTDLDPRQTLEYIRSLLAAASMNAPSADPIEGDLPGFADAILERWQRPAARSGQLLIVEVGDDAGAVAVDWAVLRAVSETLLGARVRRQTVGALHVVLGVSTEGASIAISGSGPTLVAELVDAALATPTAWPAVGPGCEELAVVHAIVESVSGRMLVECGEGTTSVSVVVPPAPPGSAGQA